MSKICVIIPAYNESGSISSVIKEVKARKNLDIVIVNDNSTDNTAKVAQKENVLILNLPCNLGIGGAVQTGLIYAKENGFKTAVQIDADGQHNPKYLPKLLKNLNDSIDMVIASRYVKKTKYKTPFFRRLGIIIFSKLIKATCNKKVYDATSGYRVFGKRAIDFFSKNYPQEFPEPRSIVSFLKNGYKIKEVAVEMRQRKAGKSSVTPFYSVYLMLSISIAILVQALKTNSNDGY